RVFLRKRGYGSAPTGRRDRTRGEADLRTTGSNRDETWRRVRSAGVELLFEHGYEVMNTRQLAEAAELKPGSLYYYFRSKEEFLYRLLIDLLEDIVADLELGLSKVDPS